MGLLRWLEQQRERRLREEYAKLTEHLDIETSIRRLVYRGFDSYQDYEKYGDMFVTIRLPEDKH